MKRSGKASVEVLEKCIPTIHINKDAMIKMKLYIDECNDEIGWLGTAYKRDNVIYVDDVFLLEQQVHGTTTEIMPDDLTKFADDLLKQKDGMDVWNNIKLYGHSHVNMTVSPSGQDDQTLEKFASIGHDWFIRLIGNKKEDMRVDLYDYTTGIIYNNAPFDVVLPDNMMKIKNKILELEAQLEKYESERVAEFEENIKKEIKEKVREIGYGNKVKKTGGTIWDQRNNESYYDAMNVYGYGYQAYGSEAIDIKKKDDEQEEFWEIDESDVVHLFAASEIAEIASMTYKEASEYIQTYIYSNVFSSIELYDIWKACQKLLYEGAV